MSGLRLGCCTEILSRFWLLGAAGTKAAIVFDEGMELADRGADVRTLAVLNVRYANIRLAHSAADTLGYAEKQRVLQTKSAPRLRLPW